MTDAPAPAFDSHRLLAWMDHNGVACRTLEHAPVFRVEEGQAIKSALPGAHTKNLFLKDRKDRLWLVSARQDTVIDLKALPARIGADRLSFGRPELLWRTLGVTPGSVTALGLINDAAGQVGFVLDRRLAEADIVNFHPLTNTATTALSRDAFARFLTLIGREPLVVDFSDLG